MNAIIQLGISSHTGMIATVARNNTRFMASNSVGQAVIVGYATLSGAPTQQQMIVLYKKIWWSFL